MPPRKHNPPSHKGAREGAIFLDLDDDVVALLVRVERERPDAALAEPLALLRRLDAVIDRVADEVQQRPSVAGGCNGSNTAGPTARPTSKV